MNTQNYRYKLIISYDGTNYSGWQVQPNSISIQELIEKALFTLFHYPVKAISSSRTDAGVHALGQVAHISLTEPVDEEKLIFSLNGLLPRDIRIKSLHATSPDFHARFDAKRKVYHYHLHCEQFHDPSKRFYSYHVRPKLDIEAMKKAIPHFVGTHNFKAFANKNEKGSAKNSPVKTIYTIDLVEERGGYRLEFEGDGFLYKMVRNIVGTLLDCSYGKTDPDTIPDLLASLQRKQTACAAPAHGLFLIRVDYE